MGRTKNVQKCDSIYQRADHTVRRASYHPQESTESQQISWYYRTHSIAGFLRAADWEVILGQNLQNCWTWLGGFSQPISVHQRTDHEGHKAWSCCSISRNISKRLPMMWNICQHCSNAELPSLQAHLTLSWDGVIHHWKSSVYSLCIPDSLISPV